MDEPTVQTPEQTLPELVRFTLEHLRNLQLKGPSTLQAEHYAKIWHSLSTAGKKLVDQIDDLRFNGYERWETGDEASVELFGRLGVPKGKEFLQTAMRELASLGTRWHASSTVANIDTQRFDPGQVPCLVELEATIEDIKLEDEDVKMEGVKMEDVETEDFKEEDVVEDTVTNQTVKTEALKKEIVEPKGIKTEITEPSPPGPVFPSIESKYTPFAS